MVFKQISGIKNLSTQSLSKIIKNTLLLYPLCIIIHHATSPSIILNGQCLNSIMNSQDSSVLATRTKYKSSPSESDQNPTAYIRLCIACCIYKVQSFQGIRNSTLSFRFLCIIPFGMWMQHYSKIKLTAQCLRLWLLPPEHLKVKNNISLLS